MMSPPLLVDTAAPWSSPAAGDVGVSNPVAASKPSLREPALLPVIAAALAAHATLLFSGAFRRTFDAYVHMFFADHYARDWFSLWEPRWYGGFSVASYPPGVHQSIALLSTGVGLEAAYAIVQLAALTLVVIGTYRFARLWVGQVAAGWAAVLTVVSSSVVEVVYVFGQLPTTMSLAFLLNAQPAVRRWIREGHGWSLAMAVAALGATTATHHVTTLFGSVFFTGPVLIRAMLDSRSAQTATPAGQHRRWRRALRDKDLRRLVLRATVLTVAVAAALIAVVLPYWIWTVTDPISQVPIPHGSRNSFITDAHARLLFFAVPWGALLLIAPAALHRGLRSTAWPLATSVLILTVLGLGGTTPLPRLLLGPAHDVLTLERFTIWATIAVLPLAGAVIEDWLRPGRTATESSRGGRRAVTGLVAISFVGSAVLAANLPTLRPQQPGQIDMAPIVTFLEDDEHHTWRYLTLGFGDQMAWLSAQTRAGTIDGNYHSARRVPLLTSRPIERLDGAKYHGESALEALREVLADPGAYHLKFVFSTDRFYDPLLRSLGWRRLPPLDNGIAAWERRGVAPLSGREPVPTHAPWEPLAWGIVPMAALTLAIAGLAWQALHGPVQRLRRSRRLPDARLPLSYPGSDSARRRPWLIGLAATVAMGSAATVLIQPAESRAPQGTAQIFYEALRDHRFDDARLLVEPAGRPSYQAFLDDIPETRELLESYARISDISVRPVTVSDDVATVSVDVTLSTAVDETTVTRRHRLERVDGNWYLDTDQHQGRVRDAATASSGAGRF